MCVVHSVYSIVKVYGVCFCDYTMCVYILCVCVCWCHSVLDIYWDYGFYICSWLLCWFICSICLPCAIPLSWLSSCCFIDWFNVLSIVCILVVHMYAPSPFPYHKHCIYDVSWWAYVVLYGWMHILCWMCSCCIIQVLCVHVYYRNKHINKHTCINT